MAEHTRTLTHTHTSKKKREIRRERQRFQAKQRERDEEKKKNSGKKEEKWKEEEEEEEEEGGVEKRGRHAKAVEPQPWSASNHPRFHLLGVYLILFIFFVLTGSTGFLVDPLGRWRVLLVFFTDPHHHHDSVLPGFLLILFGQIWLDRVWLDLTGFDWVLLGYSLYWSSPVLLNLIWIDLYWVLLGITGFFLSFWAPQFSLWWLSFTGLGFGFTGFYRVFFFLRCELPSRGFTLQFVYGWH